MKISSLKNTKLYAFASTDIGTRQENQDNYLIIQKEEDRIIAKYLKDEQELVKPINNWNESKIRIAVADGMGGHANGRQIAEELIEELIKLPAQESLEGIRNEINVIHHKLYDRHLPHTEKSPGTTLIMADLDINTGKGVLLNVGDSRAYMLSKPVLWKKPAPVQITFDHSNAEFSYRDGEMDSETYMHHRNSQQIRIAQAIGFGSRGIVKDSDGNKPFRPDKKLRIDMKPDLSSSFKSHADVINFKISRRQIMMLSSDGLWSGEENGQWFYSKPLTGINQEITNQLIENVKERNINDNITLILCGWIIKN